MAADGVGGRDRVDGDGGDSLEDGLGLCGREGGREGHAGDRGKGRGLKLETERYHGVDCGMIIIALIVTPPATCITLVEDIATTIAAPRIASSSDSTVWLRSTTPLSGGILHLILGS